MQVHETGEKEFWLKHFCGTKPFHNLDSFPIAVLFQNIFSNFHCNQKIFIQFLINQYICSRQTSQNKGPGNLVTSRSSSVIFTCQKLTFYSASNLFQQP